MQPRTNLITLIRQMPTRPSTNPDPATTNRDPTPATRLGLLALIGPGILVAATGVGAGDLATAALVGSRLGLAVLWAVLVGAFLKYVLNEGLTRWQLATGQTLLEGCAAHFGPVVRYGFLIYFVCWSYLVAAALMSACGVTAHAILPVFDSPVTGKIVFGIAHSLVGLVLVRWGGFRLFERVMGVCIAVMFVVVTITAIRLTQSWGQVAQSLVWPRIPDFAGQGRTWTVALMGGVGGTVTVLCYGYWIRERGRASVNDLSLCRIDLLCGYVMTAVFGVAMVIIGSTIQVRGRGASLVVDLGERLAGPLGPIGKWAFLLGAWSAVTSSLLGVWQAIPYLFADTLRLMRRRDRHVAGDPVDTRGQPYRLYMIALAIVPMIGLWHGFARVQKYYALLGAVFMPMLAAALLILNGRRSLVGKHTNKPLTVMVLVLTLLFFLATFVWEWVSLTHVD